VVLLTSALLTAGYLLPITVNGFLPGGDFDYAAMEKKEPNATMLVPLLIFAALAVLLGLLPGALTDYITGIVAGVL
jgi:multicomponent Na+:H+ antiporter subunit D